MELKVNEDWVIEIRRQNDEAMKRASTVIEEAYADFRKVMGRGPEIGRASCRERVIGYV